MSQRPLHQQIKKCPACLGTGKQNSGEIIIVSRIKDLELELALDAKKHLAAQQCFTCKGQGKVIVVTKIPQGRVSGFVQDYYQPIQHIQC